MATGPQSTDGPIPDSVVALLRRRWPFPPNGSSMFEDVFGDNPERQRDPSYYYLRPGDQAGDLSECFSHADAVALIAEGVFGDLAEDQGDRVAISEHAQHALVDFCEEVYALWATYLDRLVRAERVCRVGPNRTPPG